MENSENEAFSLPSSLKSKLTYGLKATELQNSAEDLAKSYLYTKAASYLSLENAIAIQLPFQWQSASIHRFLMAAIQSQESDLFYEWAIFLNRKAIVFPANVLAPLMNWAVADLNIADFVLPFLGPLGDQMANLFPEYALLSKQKQEEPLQFTKLDHRFFAFQKFRAIKTELAFNYFLQIEQELKDAEKIKWLKILRTNLNIEEWNILFDLYKNKKLAIKQEINAMQLAIDVIAFNHQNIQFQQMLNEDRLEEYFTSISPNLENAIQLTPLKYLSSQENFQKYFDFLLKMNALPALLLAIKVQNHKDFAIWCFEILLDRKLLKEKLKLGSLSFNLDHKTFNQFCIQWIEIEQDTMDIEAFLFFIRQEKHFWSDELLLKILELRNSKILNRTYDFSVFWQMLPYKINPNSTQIQHIPDECKINFNQNLNFNSIIQFRKGIRR